MGSLARHVLREANTHAGYGASSSRHRHRHRRCCRRRRGSRRAESRPRPRSSFARRGGGETSADTRLRVP